MIIVLSVALLCALGVIVWQRRRIGQLDYSAEFFARMAGRNRAEALAAEARSRNVGGTGEHGAPVTTIISPVSRVSSMYRDPRFTIPTDRPRP